MYTTPFALGEEGPHGVSLLHAVAGAPFGGFVLAYEIDADNGGAGPTKRLVHVDWNGLVTWVRAIDASDELSLLPSPPDGRILFVDRRQHTALWLDPRTGETTGILGADFDPCDHRGVVVDVDGTILVLKPWDDGEASSLRRFTRDGAPLPVWAWTRDAPLEYPGWDGLYGGGVVAPEPNARLAGGWDGRIFFYTDSAIAPVERDGRVTRVVTLPGDVVRDVFALGADASGIAYALVGPARSIGDVDSRAVVRISPAGEWHFWLGQGVPGSPSRIGPFDQHMATMPDGTLLVADGTSLRVISADGRTTWRSAGAATRDALFAE